MARLPIYNSHFRPESFGICKNESDPGSTNSLRPISAVAFLDQNIFGTSLIFENLPLRAR